MNTAVLPTQRPAAHDGRTPATDEITCNIPSADGMNPAFCNMTTATLSPSKKDFRGSERAEAGEWEPSDPPSFPASPRILIVVANESRFEDLRTRCLECCPNPGQIHWISHYGTARDALGRQTYDAAILDGHHQGLSLLDEMAGDGSTTAAIVLVDNPSLHREPAGVVCAFVARNALTTGDLLLAIRGVLDRAATVTTAAHSRTWWRCGGLTVSHASDFPVLPGAHGNFFIDATVQEGREELQTMILRHLPVIAGRLDAAGFIREVDGAGLRRHGLDPRELRGARFLAVFPEGGIALTRARAGEPARFEACLDVGAAEAWHVEFELFPDNEASSGVMFFGQEVTLRSGVEGEILRAVEAERHRLGADLHDNVGQLLTGIACLSTALVKRLLGRDDLAAENATTIADVAKEALAQMRALAHGLAPVHLARQSLAAALGELRQQVQRLHDVEVRLQVPSGGNEFDGGTTTHLFRIAQEAIANAIRHGNATSIDVSLRGASGQYQLVIADNGRGFDSTTSHKRSGSGLGLMEYRATLIRGTLAVSSDPAKGTRIEITFNLLNTRPHENAC